MWPWPRSRAPERTSIIRGLGYPVDGAGCEAATQNLRTTNTFIYPGSPRITAWALATPLHSLQSWRHRTPECTPKPEPRRLALASSRIARYAQGRTWTPCVGGLEHMASPHSIDRRPFLLLWLASAARPHGVILLARILHEKGTRKLAPC